MRIDSSAWAGQLAPRVSGGRGGASFAFALPAESQQTSRPRPTDQPANLWEPADGRRDPDAGAHGDFDDRSTVRSVQLWASQHHGLLAAAGGALAAGIGWALANRVGARQMRY